jgi:multiple sugar transport system substrate-binding protein
MMEGVETWMDPRNNQAFLAGGISLTPNGSSILYASKNKFPDIYHDLGVMNCPTGPVKHPAELSMISQAFIFRHSPFPNAAKHFLAFMLERSQYSRWIAETGGYITQPLRNYYDLPVWKSDPRMTPYRECVKRMLWNGYAGPLGTASAALMSEYVVVDMFADVCTGRKTPRNAARYAENQIRKFYRSPASKG